MKETKFEQFYEDNIRIFDLLKYKKRLIYAKKARVDYLQSKV